MNLSQVGEKRLIADFIRPRFNPACDPDSVGNDCAVLKVGSETDVCFSTDRVPADLISFKLGLIDSRQLGYYLAILNLSDLAAAGAIPAGMLLNFAFPPQFPLDQFNQIMEGIQQASAEYDCPVLGGDLSDAAEINLVATSIGRLPGPKRLYRSRARSGHVVFCSAEIGLTPAAFAFFLSEAPRPISLSVEEEERLCAHFRSPSARIKLGSALRESGACSALMDNTDGVGQSLLEIGQASGVGIRINEVALPIASLCSRIATTLGRNVTEFATGPGADFQLIGTADPAHPGFAEISSHLHIIGEVLPGNGVFVKTASREIEALKISGWNYYEPRKRP